MLFEPSGDSEPDNRDPVAASAGHSLEEDPAGLNLPEDEIPVDRPLYILEPHVQRMQQATLRAMIGGFVAILAAISIVAIAVGSVPTALVSAAGILALGLWHMVRYLFPMQGGRKKY